MVDMTPINNNIRTGFLTALFVMIVAYIHFGSQYGVQAIYVLTPALVICGIVIIAWGKSVDNNPGLWD